MHFELCKCEEQVDLVSKANEEAMKALHMDYGSLVDDPNPAPVQVSYLLYCTPLYTTSLYFTLLYSGLPYRHSHLFGSLLLFLRKVPGPSLGLGLGLGPSSSSAPSMLGKAPMTPKSSGKHAPAFTETGVFAPGNRPD